MTVPQKPDLIFSIIVKFDRLFANTPESSAGARRNGCRILRAQQPFQAGGRLLRKASTPSWASAVTLSAANISLE